MSRAAMNLPALLGLAATVCALATPSASAAVIASQAPLDGGDSFDSSITFGLQNGDTFAMSNSGEVTGLEWWGTETFEIGGGAIDTEGFFIRIFDTLSANAVPVFECDFLGNASTLCDAPIMESSAGLADSFGDPIRKFSIDFATPIALAAGTHLLSIGYEDSVPWYWLEGSGGDGESHFRAADDEAWLGAPPDLAFSVIGELDDPVTVPEPATLALLGLAGFGGLLSRYRRRVAA